MGSFGQRLQREREMRGITLEEIATSTKIGTRSLRALEEEDFDQLPGGIFNKGFVRAYAKYLGIDEEQAVADYLTASGEGEPPLPTPPEKKQEDYTTIREGGSNGVWVALAIVALLGMGAYAGWRWYQNTQAAAESEPPAVSSPAPPSAAVQQQQPQGDAAATPTPTPDAGAVSATPSATPSPSAASATPPELKKDTKTDGFLLSIRAKQDAWVKYYVDDSETPREWTMKADEQHEIRAQRKVKLVLGNAGGVEISHNGKTLPQLGAEKQARVLIFTAEGLQR
jgi:cytoskeleton protein RodZ